MSAINKASTELDQLAAGLGNAEDPYYIKPFAKKSLDELAELARQEIKYSTLSMLKAGRYFIAIKARLDHGQWIDFVVKKQRWSMSYVRASMKLLEVAARFPNAMHLPSGRTLDRLLHLPPPIQSDVLEGLSPEAIRKLTPWDIERIYDAKRDEMRKTNRRKKKVDPALLDQEKREREEKEWAEFDDAYNAATNALNELAAVKIKPEWRDRIFDRELLKKLGRVYEKVSKSLAPVEEVLKRREIVHVAGFAKGARR